MVPDQRSGVAARTGLSSPGRSSSRSQSPAPRHPLRALGSPIGSPLAALDPPVCSQAQPVLSTVQWTDSGRQLWSVPCWPGG